MGNRRTKDSKASRGKATKKKQSASRVQTSPDPIPWCCRDLDQGPSPLTPGLQDFWRDLSLSEKQQLLVVDLATIRHRAQHVSGMMVGVTNNGVSNTYWQVPLKDTLEKGVQRLRKTGTCKSWCLGNDSPEFSDKKAFLEYLHTSCVPSNLQGLLPLAELDVRGIEELAEKMEVMTEQVAKAKSSMKDLGPTKKCSGQKENHPKKTYDYYTNVKVCGTLLAALFQVHEGLYQCCVEDIVDYMRECQGQDMLSSPGNYEPEDLLALTYDQVVRINRWIIEKIKRVLKDLNELGEVRSDLANMDTVELAGDGEHLVVRPEWLEYLQRDPQDSDTDDDDYDYDEDDEYSDDDEEEEDLLDLRKGTGGEEMDPVLGWIYSKTFPPHSQLLAKVHLQLGKKSICPEAACKALVGALEEQMELESLLQHIKNDMDVLSGLPGSNPPGPDGGDSPAKPMMTSVEVMSKMSQEYQLVMAQIHCLDVSLKKDTKSMRLNTFLIRQANTQRRCLNQIMAEMELGGPQKVSQKSGHKQPLVNTRDIAALDAAVEEESKHAKKTAEQMHVVDLRLNNNLKEKSHLKDWLMMLARMVKRLEGLQGDVDHDKGLQVPQADVTAPTPEQEAVTQEVLAAFQRDIAPRCLSATQQEELAKKLAVDLEMCFQNMDLALVEGAVILQHLEIQVVRMACDDAGATISALLVVPVLRELLHDKVLEQEDKRAQEVLDEILRMEEEEKLAHERRLAKNREKRKALKKKNRSIPSVKGLQVNEPEEGSTMRGEVSDVEELTAATTHPPHTLNSPPDTFSSISPSLSEATVAAPVISQQVGDGSGRTADVVPRSHGHDWKKSPGKGRADLWEPGPQWRRGHGRGRGPDCIKDQFLNRAGGHWRGLSQSDDVSQKDCGRQLARPQGSWRCEEEYGDPRGCKNWGGDGWQLGTRREGAHQQVPSMLGYHSNTQSASKASLPPLTAVAPMCPVAKVNDDSDDDDDDDLMISAQDALELQREITAWEQW